jgi:hypothetical protein
MADPVNLTIQNAGSIEEQRKIKETLTPQQMVCYLAL